MKYILRGVLIVIVSIATFIAKATTIYSGNCVCIRRVWIQGNKESDAVIFTQFAKVIIDRTGHKFTLYYNGERVFTGDITGDRRDDTQGVEDFVVNGGLQSGRLYIAEKAFYIDIPKRKSDGNDVMGYRFQLENYTQDQL